MRAAPRLRAILPVLLLLLAACGAKDPIGPGTPAPPPPPPPPTPIVGDTLLPGTPGSQALEAVVAKAPVAAPPGERSAGLLLTRLDAVLKPTATVAEVNAALLASGARIQSSRVGSPFVTLRIPPVADLAAARALGAQLVASGAFAVAVPARQLSRSLDPARPVAREAPPSGITGLEHLADTRIPAAWNVQEAIVAGPPVPILLPDAFYQATVPPEIPPLFFSPGAGTPITDALPDGAYDGNHGFHVAGIIAAAHNQTTPTGVVPTPNAVALNGIQLGGLTPSEVLAAIEARIPPTGPVIASISMAFADAGVSAADRLELTKLAYEWRFLTKNATDRLLVVAASGNHGQATNVPGLGTANLAQWASPWTLSARVADLRTVLQNIGLDPAAVTGFDAVWTNWTALYPETAAASTNVLIVGASDGDGAELAASGKNPDVRMVGAAVLGPCVIADPGYPAEPTFCNGTTARYSGTSMAVPQVAGLAAYVLALRPELPISSLRALLVVSYDPANGVVDGYRAVLQLDAGLAVGDLPLRARLLDVAGGDDQFDLADIEVFLEKFAFYKDLWDAAPVPERDYSRYDLNGNGATGDIINAPFDLDGDGAIGTVTQDLDGFPQSFNEADLSDLSILCYYAWSPLYTGNPTDRTAALGAECGIPTLEFNTGINVSGDLDSGSGCALAVDSTVTSPPASSASLLLAASTNCPFGPHTGMMSYDGDNLAVGTGGLRLRSSADYKVGADASGGISGNLGFVDHFIIDAPGLAGTTGTVRFTATLTARALLGAVPCKLDVGPGGTFESDSSRYGQANATVSVALDGAGETVTFSRGSCNNDPGTNTQAVVAVTSDPVPFVYGLPLSVIISATARADIAFEGDSDPGPMFAEAEGSWVWGGLLDLPIGATVRSASGYDWKNAVMPSAATAPTSARRR